MNLLRVAVSVGIFLISVSTAMADFGGAGVSGSWDQTKVFVQCTTWPTEGRTDCTYEGNLVYDGGWIRKDGGPILGQIEQVQP